MVSIWDVDAINREMARLKEEVEKDMTYTPKVGDIVNVCAKVVDKHPKLDYLVEVQITGARNTYATIDLRRENVITLVERAKRELKPGDRIKHKWANAEYVVLNVPHTDKNAGEYLASLAEHADTRRSNTTFDTAPYDWQYFPRNETPEDA